MKVLSKYSKRLVPVALAFALVAGQASVASAATLTNASLSQDNPAAAATGVQHTFTVSGVSGVAIECVSVDYGTAVDGSGAVAGLSVTGATFVGGASNLVPGSWTVDNSLAASGVVRVTGAATTPSASARTLTLGAITNGTAGDFYAVVRTYSNAACSTAVDEVVIAGEWEDSVDVFVAVDPTLTFTVANSTTACNGQATPNATPGATATSLNMGRVTDATTAGAAQTVAVTTNAANGWTVTVETDVAPNAMRSGGNSITDVTPNAAIAAGAEAFGFTHVGATASTFKPLTQAAQVVANQGTASPCIGFQVAVSGNTEAGRYAAKAIYTAVPVF